MNSDSRTLRHDEPLAIELTAAVKQGEVERLRRLLAAEPGLARCVVEDAKGGGRTPLHLFADWPGHNPNAATVVHTLHAAGADIEHEGSSIDGGAPLSSAVGYGQWAAARRLVERGARTVLWHEAALGLIAAIKRRVEADPPPSPDALSGPFWNACHGGQLAAAQYLLAHGADLNWPAPWSGQTPLDIAEKAGRGEVVAWLREMGAVRGEASA